MGGWCQGVVRGALPLLAAGGYPAGGYPAEADPTFTLHSPLQSDIFPYTFLAHFCLIVPINLKSRPPLWEFFPNPQLVLQSFGHFCGCVYAAAFNRCETPYFT